MASGLEYPHIIDMVALDSARDEIALVMTEIRPWEGLDHQLFQLQEKINAYLSFALDGEMLEEHPEWENKAIRLQLNTKYPPDERAIQFLKVVRDQVAFQNIRLEIHVEQASEGCGGNCSCKGGEAAQ